MPEGAVPAGAVVLVALKPLAEAKSRLDELGEGWRRRLVLAMLDDVLMAVRGAHAGALWLLSSDAEYDAAAARHDARRLPDAAEGYRAAVQAVLDGPAADLAAALVLPADVPGLRAADVTRLLAALAEAEVVVAPSADGGTSALGLRPPAAIAVAFGPDSGAVHVRLARAAGRTLAELDLPSIAVDVDVPADLEAVHAAAGPATRALLAELPAFGAAGRGRETR